MNIPVPTIRKPIEAKVVWASGAAYVGGVVALAILQAIADLNLIKSLPGVLGMLAGGLLPGLIAFVAGYVKRNKPLG